MVTGWAHLQLTAKRIHSLADWLRSTLDSLVSAHLHSCSYIGCVPFRTVIHSCPPTIFSWSRPNIQIGHRSLPCPSSAGIAHTNGFAHAQSIVEAVSASCDSRSSLRHILCPISWNGRNKLFERIFILLIGAARHWWWVLGPIFLFEPELISSPRTWNCARSPRYIDWFLSAVYSGDTAQLSPLALIFGRNSLHKKRRRHLHPRPIGL